MRATLLGHASYVVEGGGAVIFVDPVFGDPFEEACVSCPQRVVHRDKLPRPNAVFLSHGHHDHFDPPSLQTLPRSTPIYVPGDDSLLEDLAKLGFYKARAIDLYEPVMVGGMSVIATRSRDSREVGFLWVDDTAVIWNQVDTAVDQRACVEVASLLKRPLDVGIVTYMPLLEYAEAWVSETAFPRERYDRLLETALMTRAQTIIPGSSGERLSGRAEWLNHRIFPVTREKFLADLHDIAPEQKSLIINPGDTIVVESGQPVGVEKSAYADTIAMDVDRISFKPHETPVRQLVDENERGYTDETFTAKLTAIIEHDLPRAMRAAMTDTLTGPLRTAWDRRYRLQIDAVTPFGVRSWYLSGWSPPVWLPGPDAKPDYVFRYVASTLVDYYDRKSVELPEVQYLRIDNPPQPGEPYRLAALDPARLHGVDLYYTVDEQYWWSPLMTLIGALRA